MNIYRFTKSDKELIHVESLRRYRMRIRLAIKAIRGFQRQEQIARNGLNALMRVRNEEIHSADR